VLVAQGRQCGAFSDKLLQSGTFWAKKIRSNAASGAINQPVSGRIATRNSGNNQCLLGKSTLTDHPMRVGGFPRFEPFSNRPFAILAQSLGFLKMA
jgi:hypothetical protein